MLYAARRGHSSVGGGVQGSIGVRRGAFGGTLYGALRARAGLCVEVCWGPSWPSGGM